MRITYFHRRPQEGAYSIERHFADVRNALPPSIDYCITVAKYPSKGIFSRLFNAISAMRKQTDVNHITGDIHYLAMFLKKEDFAYYLRLLYSRAIAWPSEMGCFLLLVLVA